MTITTKHALHLQRAHEHQTSASPTEGYLGIGVAGRAGWRTGEGESGHPGAWLRTHQIPISSVSIIHWLVLVVPQARPTHTMSLSHSCLSHAPRCALSIQNINLYPKHWRGSLKSWRVGVLCAAERVKLYNSMLGTNSSIFCRVVQADLKLQSKDDKWTAQPEYRLQGVWREVESVDPRGNNNKVATYQAWFATPFACNARQTYVTLTWFWLRAHTLKVESAVWQDGTS
eukprot:1156986-Pelagomonas_calceolata.AAC.4